MRIKLNNFRKYRDITFDLSDNGITKISGDSGSGKSTLFDAIYWCLYGKLQKVATRSKDSGSQHKVGATSVSIEIPYKDGTMQIDRHNSKNVDVFIDDKSYSGLEAQSIINDYFGCNDTFLMTSYLRAESMHKLLSESVSKRRELTNLLFPDAAKYDKYKAKLLEYRKEDEILLYKRQKSIAASTSSISTLEEANPWLLESTSNDIDANNLSVSDIQNKIKALQSERDKIYKLQNTYECLTQQLLSISDPIDTTLIEKELQEIKDRILKASIENKSKEEKIDYLQKEIDKVKDRISNVVSFLPSFDSDEYKRLIDICDTLLKIATSSDSIRSKLDNAKDEYNKESAKLLSYEQSLQNIEYNRKLEDIIICPECNTNLRYTDDGILIKSTESIEPRPIEHNISHDDVRKLRIRVDKLDDIKNKISKQFNIYHDTLAKDKLQKYDISKLREQLGEYISLTSQLNTLNLDLDKVLKDDREYLNKDEFKKLETRSKEITLIINKESANTTLRESIQSKIKHLDDTLDHNVYTDKISQLDTDIASLRVDLEKIQQNESKEKVRKIYNSHKEKLSRLEVSLSEIQHVVDASYKLEVILAQAYKEYVGKKLHEIEYDICILGKIFFDESMNISLCSSEETSTGIIKPSFDLKVEYGGIAYDDISQMSTGERKRLSLILMITLTKYIDGRMMLLDEALTSIGMDTRGIIIGELQKLEIPIYITSHDDITGHTYELTLSNE